jgi:uncharacterized membrane protein
MKTPVLLALFLVLSATGAPAQDDSARILDHAPGQVWTLATGAGDPYHGGYGAGPDFRLPGHWRAMLIGNGTFLDVTPDDRKGAIINDSDGRLHGGGASPGDTYPAYAYVWNDATPVNLHPDGYDLSEVLGVGGGMAVGYVVGSAFCPPCRRLVTRHAARWNGSAGSLQLLHATAHDLVSAWDTDGAEIVGQGQDVEAGQPHALLWKADGVEAIDLHPGGVYEQSLAADVSAGAQVGSVFGAASGYHLHAARWAGSPESFVDLNPPGYAQSSARAVRKGTVVGSGSTHAEPWRYKALAWTGGAESFVDLHAALPEEFQAWNSSADAIDEKGNIVGMIELGGDLRAVTWSPLDGRGGGGTIAAGGTDVPVAFSLGQAVPNPTTRSVRFRLGLPQASTVELALYDVRGHRVRGEARALDAGWQVWAWDGVDDAGQSVASGVYFARMTVGGREYGRHKVVVTR